MNKKIAAMSLSSIGTVFIMAMAFDILPNNIALFGAAICFMLSGLTWSVFPTRNQEKRSE